MKNSLVAAWRSSFGLINTMTVLLVWVFAAKYALLAWQDWSDPFTDYFRPRWLYIPDHCEGDDPMIEYGRAVDKAFPGAFHGAFNSTDGGLFPVGDLKETKFPYEPKPYLIVRMKLSVFIGNDRLPPPGRWHRIETWDRLFPGRRVASLTLKSNTFTIWPVEDPHCDRD